jgi:hypothetical protein
MRLVYVLALAPVLALAEKAPPNPPRLLSPADDPNDEHCLTPDAETGIRLSWEMAPGGYPVSSYLEVRRYDEATGEWKPWVKTYVHQPPFTLNAKSRTVYNSAFAWRVWAVDRTGEAEPYALASPWQEFCTR